MSQNAPALAKAPSQSHAFNSVLEVLLIQPVEQRSQVVMAAFRCRQQLASALAPRDQRPFLHHDRIDIGPIRGMNRAWNSSAEEFRQQDNRERFDNFFGCLLKQITQADIQLPVAKTDRMVDSHKRIELHVHRLAVAAEAQGFNRLLKNPLRLLQWSFNFFEESQLTHYRLI